MHDCNETLVWTVIIDKWMVVVNVKKLGIAEKFSIYTATYIYIYIYIYIYNLSKLLILLLNNVHYTMVYRVKNLIVFSMFVCL